MKKLVAVIAVATVLSGCAPERPDYTGAWTVIGDQPSNWIIGRDTILVVGSRLLADELYWRALDDGSIFFEMSAGNSFVAEVVLHTNDRLTLVVATDTLLLVRDVEPPSYVADFVDGRISLSDLYDHVDSVRVARDQALERVLRAGMPDTGERSEQAPPEPVPVDWLTVDRSARTVEIEMVAGLDQTNNRWNFNGYAHGQATLVVPEGYDVTINFRNEDPANPHSLGIDFRAGDTWPATFQDPSPVFPGAITTSPTSMTRSTLPGQSETIRFTASRSGMFSIVCYVPAHAAVGMWVLFHVSPEGRVGVIES